MKGVIAGAGLPGKPHQGSHSVTVQENPLYHISNEYVFLLNRAVA